MCVWGGRSWTAVHLTSPLTLNHTIQNLQAPFPESHAEHRAWHHAAAQGIQASGCLDCTCPVYSSFSQVGVGAGGPWQLAGPAPLHQERVRLSRPRAEDRPLRPAGDSHACISSSQAAGVQLPAPNTCSATKPSFFPIRASQLHLHLNYYVITNLRYLVMT